MSSAVHEQRAYTVTCGRRISEGCKKQARLVSTSKDDENPRSLAQAEATYRADGWTLHSDGTATCEPCMDRWNSPPGDLMSVSEAFQGDGDGE